MHYVVKFKENPQGTKTLANDFLGAHIFARLGISVAPATVISVTAALCEDAEFRAINRAIYGGRVQPGLHFASLYPGNPSRTIVHDLFPSMVKRTFLNSEDFIGALVADKWLANSDIRQAVYFRAGEKWICQMIDFGSILNGPHWQIHDQPWFGLAADRSVYCISEPLARLEKWLRRVECFPECALFEIAAEIPDEWLGRERLELERLLERLLRRRHRLWFLLEDCLRAKIEPFASWLKLSPSRTWRVSA